MPEETYLIFHPTRLAFLKWYFVAFIVIITGIVFILSAFNIVSLNIPFLKDNVFYILIVPFFGTVFIIIAEVLRRVDTYVITNFRVIEKYGIINIKEDSISWEKISNYSLSQNAFDRVFKIGTVKLWSMGGEGEPEVVIKKAAKIQKIRYLLDKLIQRK
jgi:uncharacterized membrane protein YdbT with pleckstrin-like domain